jgi:AraC-like DNA-binding protein
LGALGDQIRHHVRRHAHEPTLTGARIAQDLGWSLRQIQATLQQAGTTPSELIREERLRIARTKLANPDHRGHTVTAIAHASGFESTDTFTRAFRNRYDATPTEYRRTAQPGGSTS